MFDWAIALAPDDADGYAWRGYVNMQSGDYRAAQDDYRALLELKPSDFDGHSALCWAFGESKDFARAMGHCRRAMDMAFNRSELAIALENWCWLQVEMGEYEEAAEDCRFALEYAPEYRRNSRAGALQHRPRLCGAREGCARRLPHF